MTSITEEIAYAPSWIVAIMAIAAVALLMALFWLGKRACEKILAFVDYDKRWRDKNSWKKAAETSIQIIIGALILGAAAGFSYFICSVASIVKISWGL